MTLAGVQSPSGHHCCRRGGPPARRGRRDLRRRPVVGLRARRPLPRRGRRGVRTTITASEDAHRPRPIRRDRRADRRAPRRTSPPRVSTRAATRSAGISSTTTASASRAATIAPTSSPAPVSIAPAPKKRPRVVLHPFRSRTTQRVLAVRLHPLPTRRRHRHRDPVAGSTTTPATRSRSPPTSRVTGPIVARPRSAPRRPARPARINTDRQRHGLHHPLRRRPRRPQRASKPNSPVSASPRRTRGRTIRPPAAKSNASNRPSNDGSTRNPPPATITELQALLDTFADRYNHHRPHRSLPHRATPATIYTARPKATPTGRDPTRHHRVRHDRVDVGGTVTLRVNGRLHHIGIGRTHARTHVILLIDDLHVRVVDAATGELLRDLTIDPTRDYQPTGAPKGPTRPQNKRSEPQ